LELEALSISKLLTFKLPMDDEDDEKEKKREEEKTLTLTRR
jgi:hypothetical protein